MREFGVVGTYGIGDVGGAVDVGVVYGAGTQRTVDQLRLLAEKQSAQPIRHHDKFIAL